MPTNLQLHHLPLSEVLLSHSKLRLRLGLTCCSDHLNKTIERLFCFNEQFSEAPLRGHMQLIHVGIQNKVARYFDSNYALPLTTQLSEKNALWCATLVFENLATEKVDHHFLTCKCQDSSSVEFDSRRVFTEFSICV